jgi:catechol 2,3-dioxygenase-like lactoylglutathione lyase family enzyme
MVYRESLVVAAQEPDMSNTQKQSESAAASSGTGPINMSFELVVIPVSDVDRAKRFYAALGWRLDLDFTGAGDYRVIQFSPPGSACSIIFGNNVTAAAPGSSQGLYLIVSDIKAVRDELLRRGIEVSQPFHDTAGVFHHADGKNVDSGLNPQRHSYATFASFNDPDGNGWLLQEITARLSADIKPDDARFTPGIMKAIFGAKAG